MDTTLAIMAGSRLVRVMFVQGPREYVINAPSCQIHIVFTSTLKINFLRESTMADYTQLVGDSGLYLCDGRLLDDLCRFLFMYTYLL